jgi:hypothetical protein
MCRWAGYSVPKWLRFEPALGIRVAHDEPSRGIDHFVQFNLLDNSGCRPTMKLSRVDAK